MFDIPLLIYFFTKEYLLKASNERTHIPLLMNQFHMFQLSCFEREAPFLLFITEISRFEMILA